MEPQMSFRRLSIAVVVVAVLAFPAAAGGTGRVIAIGDVHGNIDGLTAILQEAGLIDDELRWSGGDATYIQLGDLFDRGVQVRETMDLLMRLQGEARKAGGRVECILGNHETMNLTGFFRDANPESYAAFVDKKSEKRRNKLWSAFKHYLERNGHPVDDATKEAWMVQHPLGWIEYVEAIGPDGLYGNWLRKRPVAVMIGDVLFIHGGISPSMAGVSVDEINAKAAKEMATFDRVRRYVVSKGIVPPGSGVTEVSEGVRMILYYAEQEDSTDLVRTYAEQVRELADIDDWLIMAAEGPLWFRGAARWDEELRGDEMAKLIAGVGADVMVVGHTPDPNGRIQSRFGGRVFAIDTGMLSSYYAGGRPSALEIADGVFTAIYLDGEREVLLDRDAEPAPRVLGAIPTVPEAITAR
jgi:hypothetical protein